jgi:hypothetical protein
MENTRAREIKRHIIHHTSIRFVSFIDSYGYTLDRWLRGRGGGAFRRSAVMVRIHHGSESDDGEVTTDERGGAVVMGAWKG